LRILISIGIGLLLCAAFLADGQVTQLLTLGSSDLLRPFARAASKAGEGWVVGVVGVVNNKVSF